MCGYFIHPEEGFTLKGGLTIFGAVFLLGCIATYVLVDKDTVPSKLILEILGGSSSNGPTYET